MTEPNLNQREAGGTPIGMLCPICRVDLVMADKQGVEIDYCPKCRGIWLDRGEIEKIVERSLQQETRLGAPRAAYPEPLPPQGYPQQAQPPSSGWSAGGHGGGGHHGSSGNYGKHGRKSWLREIFD